MRWPQLVRYASFCFGIALFIVVGVFSDRNILLLTERNQSVDHTQTVLLAIGTLESLLTRAETAQRGYIIASDPSYLQLYRDARAQVPDSVARIAALTADNEAQQKRLSAMRALIGERLDLLAKHIAQRQASGIGALDAAEISRGKVLMDGIYRLLDELRGEEDRLYRSRAATASAQARMASSVDVAGTVAGVVILLLAFTWMHREVLSRQRAEASLSALNVGLEQRVGERTALLEAQIAKGHDTEETLRAVIEESPLAIVGLAPDRSVMIWNQAAERIFGYVAAEILGRPYPLVPPEGQAEFDDIFERSAAGERLRNAYVKRRRKDGRLVECVFSGAPLYDARKQLRAIVFVLEDVTERRALEQQLRQSQKMDAIGQLTGGIAHDFNNLLGIIIGSLDLLRERVSADGISAELAHEALTGALRGAELTKRMLAFARRQPLRPKDINLNEPLPDLIEMLRRTLGENITISTSLAQDLWPALADPSQVQDAILNLGVNARDAMVQGGRLLIETANVRLDETYAAHNSEVAPGDYVMLSVTDSGTGMSKEIIERAFEPFFTTKDAGRGTGLGLSMVYGFVKQSGGHVKIYSEPGHGTTVKLYLPRGAEDAEMPAAPPIVAELPTRNETVLIVEDDARLRRVASRLLRDLGYQVRDAEGAAQALAVLESVDDVALLFTDIIMPGETGFDLARKARAIRPGLKVLFTSGYSERFVKEGEAIAFGAELITKPYRKRDLAVKLRGLLDAAD